MKGKTYFAAFAVAAILFSSIQSVAAADAVTQTPSPAAIPLDQLPPCTNPNVCGAGKDKRPDLVLKGAFVDGAEWRFDAGDKKRSVEFDAGHGGSDGGAQRGLLEKDLTLQLVLAYRKALEEKGAIVILPRAVDMFLGLDERVGTIIRHRPDVAVSVHINSSEGETTSSGIETYYTTDESKPLAEFIHKAVLKSTGAKDRGIHKNNFYIPKNSPVPTILLEHGFINNADERKLLASPEYQAKFASGMTLGLADYFKWSDEQKEKKSSAPTQSPPVKKLVSPLEQDESSYAPFFKVQPDAEWPGCYGF